MGIKRKFHKMRATCNWYGNHELRKGII